MHIVIVGAGNIGVHLAQIFSSLEYGIVLVDTNGDRLELVSRDLDVATRLGSGADWELLEELLELQPDMLVALTNHDEVNLVACSIAKQLGYPQTVARVRSDQYYKQGRLFFERMFNVDYLIGPERLTADSIANMILIPESINSESFAFGSVLMRTVKIPPRWRKEEIPLMKRGEMELPEQMMVGLIQRHHSAHSHGRGYEELIFPHGHDVLKPGDEVTFIGEKHEVHHLHKFLGVSGKIPKSVVIVGGSLIGVNLARTLEEHGVRIRIIESDYQKCITLSQQLPYTTVIHHDGLDFRFLRSEKVGDAGVFVACTRNDEVNFLAGSMAKELGADRVIISLADTSYLPLINRLGITHAASPRINAANRILSIARERTIASMVSLYENQAEVMEVKVSIDSKIAGIPIRELGPELPKDFLIVVIQSRGRVFMANGTRVMSPGDTVVVISHPKHLNEIKQLF